MADYTESVDGKAMQGIRVTAPFSSAAQLDELIAVAQAASEGENDTPLGSALRLTVQGGIYTLSGHISPLLPADLEGAEFAGVLLASARRSLTVTLPGQFMAADADSREGQTYTWSQDPTSRVARPSTSPGIPPARPPPANPITPTPAPQPPARRPNAYPRPTPPARPTLTRS